MSDEKITDDEVKKTLGLFLAAELAVNVDGLDSALRGVIAANKRLVQTIERVRRDFDSKFARNDPDKLNGVFISSLMCVGVFSVAIQQLLIIFEDVLTSDGNIPLAAFRSLIERDNRQMEFALPGGDKLMIRKNVKG